MESRGWFKETHGDKKLQGVVYFSMEFGLGEALPLYAGGLGAPVIEMGLLFQEG